MKPIKKLLAIVGIIVVAIVLLISVITKWETGVIVALACEFGLFLELD